MPVDAISNRLVSQIGAVMLVMAGLTTLTKLGQASAVKTPLWALPAISLVCLVFATVVWLLPWHRWPRRALWWLAPISLIVVMVSNTVSSEPYTYALYYVVVYIWLGIAQPRGVPLGLAPILAITYAVPQILSDQLSATALVRTVVVCVVIGETIAWMSSRLSQAQALAHRRRSEARFRSLVQRSSDVILIITRDQTISYLTPSLERLTGYPAAAVLGRPLMSLVHVEDAPTIQSYCDLLVDRPDHVEPIEWRLRCQTGSWRSVEAIGNNLLADPTVGGIVITLRDISERKALEEQLRHQAFHDPLTNLANRSLFRDRVEHELARALRHRRPVAVLFVDLDNFKTINDSLGHAVGDRLLVAAADRLRECLRPGDTAARLGGDEFAILLDDTSDAHLAAIVAQRLTDEFAAPFHLQDLADHIEIDLFVTLSIGVAVAVHGQETADELIRNADVAMFVAKRQGKAQTVVFEQSMHTAVVERMALEADLHHAIERGELWLVYQPTVDLMTGRITGAEALLRWNHPLRGPVPPSEFIAVAEETGLMVSIGHWVLTSACQQFSEWHRRHPDWSHLSLGVNLSTRQVQQGDFVADLEATLAATGLAPNALTLEITESLLIDNTPANAACLHQLRALGVHLAIDDFGTGYSSLSYLQRFPIDILKIDRSFVGDDGSEATTLVQAIVQLGHSLALTTLAEGIETLEQLRQLQDHGCHYGQGFLFAQPLSPGQFEELLVEMGQTGRLAPPPLLEMAG